MRTRMRYLLIVICFVWQLADAQQQTEKVVAALQAVRANYITADSLSFRLYYKYMDAAQPAVVLDSLQGQIERYGNKSRALIGSTEIVTTDKYIITLFNDDKIMYVAAPAANRRIADPIAMIDAVLQRGAGITCNMVHKDALEKITISFPDSSLYKQIAFTIQPGNNYLSNVEYVVKSSLLFNDAEMRFLPEHTSEYAIVETGFYDYGTILSDKAVFDAGRYFTRQDKKIIVTGQYKEYQLYLGSPNL